jgi:hypothetical protein
MGSLVCRAEYTNAKLEDISDIRQPLFTRSITNRLSRPRSNIVLIVVNFLDFSLRYDPCKAGWEEIILMKRIYRLYIRQFAYPGPT